jgi:hypothetical protein
MYVFKVKKIKIKKVCSHLTDANSKKHYSYSYSPLSLMLPKKPKFASSFPFFGLSATEFTISEVTAGLLYQPRLMMIVMMSVEQSVECLASET